LGRLSNFGRCRCYWGSLGLDGYYWLRLLGWCGSNGLLLLSNSSIWCSSSSSSRLQSDSSLCFYWDNRNDLRPSLKGSNLRVIVVFGLLGVHLGQILVVLFLFLLLFILIVLFFLVVVLEEAEDVVVDVVTPELFGQEEGLDKLLGGSSSVGHFAEDLDNNTSVNRSLAVEVAHEDLAVLKVQLQDLFVDRLVEID
jgi:hypothetical protein